MKEHTKEYFKNLLQAPICLFTDKDSTAEKFGTELSKTLKSFELNFEEKTIPDDFGTDTESTLDLTGFKTFAFSLEKIKSEHIVAILKLKLSEITCIIVQSRDEYNTWKDVIGKHPITIVGFKQGLAFFINGEIYNDKQIHPFFIVDLNAIPVDDITDWYKWSEPAAEEEEE